jgi:hypothetical protein
LADTRIASREARTNSGVHAYQVLREGKGLFGKQLRGISKKGKARKPASVRARELTSERACQ